MEGRFEHRLDDASLSLVGLIEELVRNGQLLGGPVLLGPPVEPQLLVPLCLEHARQHIVHLLLGVSVVLRLVDQGGEVVLVDGRILEAVQIAVLLEVPEARYAQPVQIRLGRVQAQRLVHTADLVLLEGLLLAHQFVGLRGCHLLLLFQLQEFLLALLPDLHLLRPPLAHVG